MVTIEDITKKEEKSKEKVRETIDLLKKSFPCLKITPIGAMVHVYQKDPPYDSVFVLELRSHMGKPLITLKDKDYFDKTVGFAKEYEDFFKGEKVLMKTDFSKPL